MPPPLPPNSIQCVDASCNPPPVPRAVTIAAPATQVLAEFYLALGLETIANATDGRDQQWTATCRDLTLTIVSGRIGDHSENAPLSFLVVDLDATITAATSAGGKLIKSPHVSSWGRRAIFADPTGRRVLLTQRDVAAAVAVEVASTGSGEGPFSIRLIEEHGPRSKLAYSSREISTDVLVALRQGARLYIWGIVCLIVAAILLWGLIYNVGDLARYFVVDQKIDRQELSKKLELFLWVVGGIGAIGVLLTLAGKLKIVDEPSSLYRGLAYTSVALDIAAIVGMLLFRFAPNATLLRLGGILTLCQWPALLTFAGFLLNAASTLRHRVMKILALINLLVSVALVLTMLLLLAMAAFGPLRTSQPETRVLIYLIGSLVIAEFILDIATLVALGVSVNGLLQRATVSADDHSRPVVFIDAD